MVLSLIVSKDKPNDPYSAQVKIKNYTSELGNPNQLGYFYITHNIVKVSEQFLSQNAIDTLDHFKDFDKKVSQDYPYSGFKWKPLVVTKICINVSITSQLLSKNKVGMFSSIYTWNLVIDVFGERESVAAVLWQMRSAMDSAIQTGGGEVEPIEWWKVPYVDYDRGYPLVRASLPICSSCGYRNQYGAKFCSQCGSSMDDGTRMYGKKKRSI